MSMPEIVVGPRPTDGDPEPGRRPRPAQRSRLRRFGRLVGLLLLAALVWTAWAVAAFYDFSSGLQDADPVSLERRIDWDGVRAGLSEDLRLSLAQQGAATTPARVDPATAGLLDRTAIANLLRTAKLDENGWDTAAPSEADRRKQGAFRWYRIVYAFYSGSPMAFRVDVRPDGTNGRRPLILLFRWYGDWRLTRVFLPADATIKPVTANAQNAASQPAPASAEPAPLPPGAQRAALYEEDASDPNGKLHAGSAVWRTEQLPPVAGGASQLAVTAHIAIPARSLSVTIAMRRNLDPSLPASHVIEMKFDLPADSPTGGIKDVVGLMMKPNEQQAGPRLAGSRVKVSGDFYLLGLSGIEADVEQNIRLLKGRPWLGIPILYNNNNRAVLVIEKGAAGEKSIEEALANWSATAATVPNGSETKN